MISILDEDIDKIKWLGGFFDGEGSCSFSQGSPALNIVNTNPFAAIRCHTLFNKYDIKAEITERSKPGKSSKKKRWDVYINKADSAILAASFLKPFVYGKRKQLELIETYANTRKNAKLFHQKMRYLNQSSNLVILSNEKLIKKIGYIPEVLDHQNLTEENTIITTYDDFNDWWYFAGIVDAEGSFTLNKHDPRKNGRLRLTAFMSIVNTNKEILSRVCSVLKNNQCGYHVQTRIPTNDLNRVRWDIVINGAKRYVFTAKNMKDKLIVKKEQANLLYDYCCSRIDNPQSTNDLGNEFKQAIKRLNEQS